MFFLPAWHPQDFLHAGPDGTDPSALWLHVVGLVNYVIGAFVALTNAGAQLRHAIETFDPAIPVLDLADARWCLTASFFALLPADEAEPQYAYA